MSLVVIGTDTEVGKTLVSAVLLARYAKQFPLAYWKPIASGLDEGPSDRERLVEWVGGEVEILPESYIFGPPLSPHLAARLAGERIDCDRVLGQLVEHGLADSERRLVLEGVGGLHVPLTDEGKLLSDFLAEISLPCLLVARTGLGTINHSLLAIEALRARGLPLAGFVLSGPKNLENRRAVERFGKVRAIELEQLPVLNREAVWRAAKHFDEECLLEEYFQ